MQISIDLRFGLPAVRDQGSRSTCMTLATSDAHRFARQLDSALSAEYLYYHSVQRTPERDPDAGVGFEAVVAALRLDGQPIEADWPYQRTQPQPWRPPKSIGPVYRHLARADVVTPAHVIKWIRAGSPVVLGLRISETFLKVRPPYVIRDDGAPVIANHSVLAVGLADDPAMGSHLLIRNSWGEGWGDHGHVWLSVEYLEHHLVGVIVLTSSIDGVGPSEAH